MPLLCHIKDITIHISFFFVICFGILIAFFLFKFLRVDGDGYSVNSFITFAES